MPSLRVAGRRKKREPNDAKVDRMLQDYLRYMDDFDVSRVRNFRKTDPSPPPDATGTLPPAKRPTLPDGELEPDPVIDELDEMEKARVRSDVRAKRERRVTTKAKKNG